MQSWLHAFTAIFSPDVNMQHYTHTHLTALFPGPPGWAGTRKVKPIWIILKQETVSGSGISWAICKSASRSRQITTPVPHHSKFFTGRMPFLPPNQQCQSTEGTEHATLIVSNIMRKQTIKNVFKTNGIQSPCQYIRHKIGWRETWKSLHLLHIQCRHWVTIFLLKL